MFVAHARLQAQRPALDALQGEDSDLLLPAVGQELLLALDEHAPLQSLDAADAAPARAIGLDQVDASFASAGEEARSDRAIFFQLVMAIARCAGAEPELGESA